MTHFDEVEICVDLERFEKPIAMGWLRRQRARSGEVFSFEYAPAWLEGGDALPSIPTSCSPGDGSTRPPAASSSESSSTPRRTAGAAF